MFDIHEAVAAAEEAKTGEGACSPEIRFPVAVLADEGGMSGCHLQHRKVARYLSYVSVLNVGRHVCRWR